VAGRAASSFEVEALSLSSTSVTAMAVSLTTAVEYKEEIPQMQVFRN